MAVVRDAATHAGSLYRKTFPFLRHPVHEIEAEAAHLHEVEQAGESAKTPLIAFLGLFLFLLPLFLVMLALAFTAYYIAR